MAHLTDTPQFKNGKWVERYLDTYFGKWYSIRKTTPHEERVLCLGDRELARDGERFFVEYKSGIQTFYLGNIFLETISVDTNNTPGWIYTCQAKYLVYACLLNGKLLIFRPEQLRQKIDDLKQKFGEKPTRKKQNEGYNTHGVPVPLDYAEKYLAEKVIILEDSDCK